MDLDKLEKNLKISIKDRDLFQTALTHRSYLNEHRNYKLPSNERLEFLGDAVLQFLTSEYLFREYPNSPEGDLTNFRAALVCTKSLAEEARHLDYGQHLLLAHGEEESGGRDREYILANTFEAILGAMYLDQPLKTCRKFLEKQLFPKLADIVKNREYKDDKSTFQELTQEDVGITPEYKVLEEWGPDHDKQFKIGVFLGSKKAGAGEGHSKQEAEQAAARNALEKWSQKG